MTTHLRTGIVSACAALACLSAVAVGQQPAQGQGPPQGQGVGLDFVLKNYYAGPSQGRRDAMLELLDKAAVVPKDKVKGVTDAIFAAYKQSPQAILATAASAHSFCMSNGEPLYYVMKKDAERGPNGYPIYIDLHGGGGAPYQVNDGDWKVHQTRYTTDGKFLAVRAPRDTWDHFHNEYFHTFVDRLIEQMIVAEDADPNRIYIMGYSSGAYGTIQLGPTMPDRFAAVATSAAATEGSLPENLYNCPFIYQVGENDTAYDRAKLAAEWGEKLKKLHADNPKGYDFKFRLVPGAGHGFDDRDVPAWLATHTRDPYPTTVVWWQNQDARESSNPVRHQMYWVAIDPAFKRDKTGTKKIKAVRDGQSIDLTVDGYDKVMVRLNDTMLNLDEPVTIKVNGKEAFKGKAQRKLSTLVKTFDEKKDPTFAFPVEIEVAVPK